MIQTVIPISEGDFQLARRLLGRFVSWKEYLEDRSFVIVAQWKDHFDAKELYGQFKSTFPNTTWAVIPDVPEDNGWPDNANHTFSQVAELMAGSTFYFMEADNFPLRPCFLDSLEQEYEAAGKPYMGAVEPTRVTLPSGEDVERGKHMVGTGIYPENFLSVCVSIHHVPLGMPFDVYIQDEVVPKCHETPLIHHAFRTACYTFDGKIITGKDQTVRPGKHSYGGPVSKEALVIHGCKDFSLWEIDFSAY